MGSKVTCHVDCASRKRAANLSATSPALVVALMQQGVFQESGLRAAEIQVRGVMAILSSYFDCA